MSNFEKANAPGFGGEITDLYISEVEDLTHSNKWAVIFQLNGDTFEVFKIPRENVFRYRDVFFPFLPGDWIFRLPEYYGCFWNAGKPLVDNPNSEVALDFAMNARQEFFTLKMNEGGYHPESDSWDPSLGDWQHLNKLGSKIYEATHNYVSKIWEIKATRGGDAVLVWWDHDLGDITMDRVSLPGSEEEGEEVSGNWDVITEGVYFEWIT